METADWPTKEDFPYIALIRILPPNVLQLAVAKTIEQVAQTMSQKECVVVIQKAANAVLQQLSTQATSQASAQSSVSASSSEKIPQGGSEFALLLQLLHRNKGPQPEPWHDLTAIGMIGQVTTKVGGHLREIMTPALQTAAKALLQR